MKKIKLDLLKDDHRVLIFRIVMPIMLSALIRTTYNIIDMIFASRLGGLQVASIAFVGPMFGIFNALGFGITTAGVTIIATAIGKGESDEATEYAVQLRYLLLILALIISLMGAMFSTSLLELLGIEGEFLEQSVAYSRIIFFTIPFSLIIGYYMSLYKAQGKMSITAQLSTISVLGNSMLNAMFIYIFKWGIEGLAVATLLTDLIKAIYVIIKYYREEHSFTLPLNIFYKPANISKIREILKVGIPLAFSKSSTSFGKMLANTFIAPFGYAVVAAFAIGNQINSIFYTLTSGIGDGLIPLVAQNFGNRNIERVRDIIRSGMTFSMVFGFFGAIAINLITKPMAILLSKNSPEIIYHVENYLRLMSWSLIAWSVFQCLKGIFNGLKKTNFTMGVTMVRLWGLRIPGLLLFVHVFSSFNEYGVWYTMFYSNVITAVIGLVLYILYIPKFLDNELQRSYT